MTTKLYLKIRVRGKEISYHSLVESKPHEIIDLLITASVNVYQTKKGIPIIMKTCFSEEKLTKEFGNPLSERPPGPLLTNHPISEQFFHDTVFVQILEITRKDRSFQG